MPGGGPQQHAGGNAKGAGEGPADQSRTHGACRLGHCDGQHKDKQRCRRGRRRLRREDPDEEHPETDHAHHQDGGDLVRGDDRTQGDEAAPYEQKRRIGGKPDWETTGKINEKQEGKGPERAEQADLRV